MLHAGQRAHAQEIEDRGRVERLATREAQANGLGHARRERTVCASCGSSPSPQAGRRVGEDLAHCLVALADAGESGRERDVRHGKLRRLEQQARRLAALGSGESERTGAHFGGEEPVQLSRAVAEPAGQSLDTLEVDDSVADETHRPRHGVRTQVPLGRPGGGIGPAAQAGPEPRLLGRGRGRVEAHVLPLGRPGGATRPAIDAGRRDRAKEPTVEAGVLALCRLVAALRVFEHE